MSNSFMNPVYIEWLDHASTQGWVHPCDLMDDEDAVLRPIKNMTFGFLIHEDKESVYISHTWTGHGMVADPIVILKALIVKRQIINPRKVSK